MHDLVVEQHQEQPAAAGVAQRHFPALIAPAQQIDGDEQRQGQFLADQQRHQDHGDQITEENDRP